SSITDSGSCFALDRRDNHAMSRSSLVKYGIVNTRSAIPLFPDGAGVATVLVEWLCCSCHDNARQTSPLGDRNGAMDERGTTSAVAMVTISLLGAVIVSNVSD